MNSKETIYKTIPLHYLLEPIDIRILSDKIRDVRIPCPLTWDPTANISFQTSWVIGEEGQRPIYLWFSKRREHGSEVHDMAAGPSGKGYIWEKRKLTSWTVPFQHIHLLLQVGCSLREELPCWQEHSCNCGLHKFHFHSWSSHFHQIQASWLGPLRNSWYGFIDSRMCVTYESGFGPIPIRLVAFVSALFPQCLLISPGEETVPGKEICLIMIS
jgi:hypothetical protein